MHLTRRSLLLRTAAACAATAAQVPALADTFPSRPVTLVVPYPPGGPADVLARMSAPVLARRLGQAVVVENRGGGDTVVGASYVAKAAPDGHTLLYGGSEVNLAPALKKGLPFDATKAFVSVAGIYATWFVFVVHPSLPVKSLREFVDYAKANPGKLNYGSPSISSLLTMETFKKETGIDVAMIPYKGGAQVTQALLANEIQACYMTLTTTLSHIQAGTLRLLAITNDTRSPLFPGIPTIREAGFANTRTHITDVAAPAGTPEAIVEQLNQAFAEISASRPFLEHCAKAGLVPLTGSPADIRKRVLDDIDHWGRIAKAVNFQPE